MAKKQFENRFQLKPESKALLAYSVARWIENNGFSRTLKRFISEAQFQDDDWKARALNLEDVFSKYLEFCNDHHKNFLHKEQETLVSSEAKSGDANRAASDEIGNKKKTRKCKDKEVNIDASISQSGNSKDLSTHGNMTESEVRLNPEKSCKTPDDLSQNEQKCELSKDSPDGKVCELPVDESSKRPKDKKKKKSKLTCELVDGDEKQIDTRAVTTEDKHNGLEYKSNGSKGESDIIMESSKDRKIKKKIKKDSPREDADEFDWANKNKVGGKDPSVIAADENEVQAKEKKIKKEATTSQEISGSGAEVIDKEMPNHGKSEEKSIQPAEGGLDDYNKASKKRKRLAPDENKSESVEEVAVEELKRRKTGGSQVLKTVEQKIFIPGANGLAESQNFSSQKNGERGNENLNKNELENSSQPKSGSRQRNGSAEPKAVNAFQRVKVDEVKFADQRLQDNSYWALDGEGKGYGAKAQEVLGQVKGRDFRHEKTKKKRGSYSGGQIDLQSHSIKFNYSDEE